MKQSEKLSILSTFIFGFLAGMYFYVTDFVFMTEPSPVPTQQQVETLVVVGEAYGGCLDTCPSFQVVSDGEYRYLYTPTAGSEQIVRDGRLPAALQRELRNTITAGTLKEQSTVIEPAVCNSYTDGIDVRYEITLQGEEYELDSCGTDVDGESESWKTLAKIWNYFETGEI